MDSPSNDVVFGRIRRRDPTSGILLQLITWGMVHPPQVRRMTMRLTLHFVNLARNLLHRD